MRSDTSPTERRTTAFATMKFSGTIAVTIVSLTAACGGDSSSTDSAPDSTASAAPEEFGLSLTELATRIEDTEALIATCMTDAGFQYVAVDFVSIKNAMGSDKSAPGLSSEDYVKQYGLGITTQFDKPLVTFGAGPETPPTSTPSPPPIRSPTAARCGERRRTGTTPGHSRKRTSPRPAAAPAPPPSRRIRPTSSRAPMSTRPTCSSNRTLG